MRFLSLTAENFMRIGRISLPLDQQGLVLVLGENLDAPKASSNGAGKSSLLDALCWCLWGTTVRGKSGDDVVNRLVGKDCKVTVTWEDGKSSYQVVRVQRSSTGKPNDLKFLVDGIPDDGKNMAATQERIVEALGLPFKTFQVMMPGAGVKLAELTDRGIKEQLEKLLRMHTISKAQELAKEELKTLTRRASLLIESIESKKALISANEAAVEYHGKLIKSFETDKQLQLEALDSKIHEQSNQLLLLSKQLESKASQEKLLETVDKQLAVKNQQLSTAKNTLKAAEDDYKSQMHQCDLEIAQLDSARKAAEAKLRQFHAIGPSCDVCEQALDDSYRAGKLDFLEKEEGKARKALKIGQDRRDAVKSSGVKSIRSVQELVGSCNSDVELVRRQREVLMKDLSESAILQREYSFMQKGLVDLQSQRSLLEKKQPPASGSISELTNKTQELRKELKDAQVELVEAQGKIEHLKFWVEGFGLKGLRSLILDYITPILNSRAEYYSNILTDGEMSVTFHTQKTLKNGNVKEEFNIEVVQKHGDSSYTGSSAGERARADLVVAFALGDLAQLRADKRIPFRFLDEPFESIDEAGHESIVKLLNEQREQYGTVFCITHKTSLQALFSKVVTITKENGISSLKVYYE